MSQIIQIVLLAHDLNAGSEIVDFLKVLRAHLGMAAQELNGALDRIPEAERNLWKVQRDQVITKLP